MDCHTQRPGAGHRRFDASAARADQFAEGFSGLADGVSHRQVLTAFKRAAPYLGISPRLVHALDTLMAWSRPIDWTPGERPIVFPSNEKLAQKLGIGVRRVQALLNQAVSLGLIWHRDSANGNRIGARGADGRLIYAYGIDLSPLGSRYAEFVARAERGAAEDRRIDVLRRRLTAARRRIRSLAQVVLDEAMDIDAESQLEIALLATRQMRHVRDEPLLEACVGQIEQRATGLAEAVKQAFEAPNGQNAAKEDSPSDESDCILNTTTNQPPSANADLRSGFPEKSRQPYDVRDGRPQTEVEADLVRHGVDPDFIVAAVPELQVRTPSPSWGELIQTAEQLADRAGIQRAVWHEACRLMGQKGAAASVIATTCKHLRGEVDRPGAYLRGMNGRAASGQLNLGRTFHGFKDNTRDQGMRALASGIEPRSIGQLAAAALKSARSAPRLF